MELSVPNRPAIVTFTARIAGGVDSAQILAVDGANNTLVSASVGSTTFQVYTFDLWNHPTFAQFVFDPTNSIASLSELEIGALTATSTPEPTTMALLGLGTAGMAGVRYRRKRKAKQAEAAVVA